MNELKWDKMFMEIATVTAKQSNASKRKVGAIAVKDGNIIGIGINGTPTGWFTNDDIDIDTGRTADEVLHAEENLVSKLARSNSSSNRATVYCTTAPCLKCARLLAQSGVARVVYKDSYKNDQGLVMMSILGMDVHKIKD